MDETKARLFRHKGCEWFPCHETQRPEAFNCLFCYCPLCTLVDRCGGVECVGFARWFAPSSH